MGFICKCSFTLMALLFVVSTILSGCSNGSKNNPDVEISSENNIGLSPDARPLGFVGRIDEKLIHALRDQRGSKRLLLMSGGGNVSASIEAAEFLRREDWSISVFGFCLSACADIVLLGADQITFIGSPLVGFHGDSLMKNHIYREVSKDPSSTCFLQHQSREDELVSAVGVNRNFWMEQLRRLVPYVSKIVQDESDCGLLRYKLESKFWYPSKNQLEKLYGLSFEGRLASESAMDHEGLIASFHKSGDTITVGDTRYRVSGERLIKAN